MIFDFQRIKLPFDNRKDKIVSLGPRESENIYPPCWVRGKGFHPRFFVIESNRIFLLIIICR